MQIFGSILCQKLFFWVDAFYPSLGTPILNIPDYPLPPRPFMYTKHEYFIANHVINRISSSVQLDNMYDNTFSHVFGCFHFNGLLYRILS